MPSEKNHESPANMALEPPLCVDLDGSLVRTDTLAESLLGLVKADFWTLCKVPIWLLRGRAYCKSQIAAKYIPNPTDLPYNAELIADLRRDKAAGRTLVLVTAADIKIANAVADSMGIFDRVMASDGQTNLKSSRKADRLVAEFGAKGFDYVGDSRADVSVWAVARRSILAKASTRVQASAKREAVEFWRIYSDPNPIRLQVISKVLRLHQWLKNLLLFVPLITSLSVLHADKVAMAALGFFIFGLCASSVYVTNDLLDVNADRQHARKRLRPFASGTISPWVGFWLAPVLLAAGVWLAVATMSATFVLTLVIYIVTTFAYSIYLKRVVLVDVTLLAMLYTLRIIAGAFALQVEPSSWLLAFSLFLFLSLALIKRYSELLEAHESGVIWIAGRGYKSTDLRLLMSLGTAAGCVSVLVLALYLDSDQVKVLYSRPFILWLLCPLQLYWIARMWMQAERANLQDDPVVFAVKDRVTRGIGVVGALVIAAAAWPV